MNETITYRKLTRAEINQLHQIDRSEYVRGIYSLREGVLVLEDVHHQLSDWSVEEKQKRIKNLQQIFDHGATFFGAFSGDQCVGMSVLDHKPVRSGNQRLNLEGLWVSNRYRGKGIGKELFQNAAREAQHLGAKFMYVSAFPSRTAVDFYLKLGCKPAEPVDEERYQKEPEDIHLEKVLSDE